MDVAIVGGHGKVALLLEAQLSAAGDRVRAVIRNPDHAADVRATGAEPVVCDTVGTTLEVFAGDTPPAAALAAL